MSGAAPRPAAQEWTPLAARALQWHQTHSTCSCHGECPTCHAQITSLLDLLDGVATDAIRVTTQTLLRIHG